MKPLRVLSIDFDYFQKVTPEIVSECYPDGNDFGTSLSSSIWISHYATYAEKLLSVLPDRENLNKLMIMLMDQKYNTPVMMVQSHKLAYTFIKENYDESKYDGIHLFNIDSHHDFFNNNKEVDCGNWIGHLKDEIPNFKLTWIANPVAKETYDIEKGSYLDKVMRFNFDILGNREFDLIFLCRSDAWLPPHLDDSFNDLYEFISKSFARAIVDKQITEPRFTHDGLITAVDEYVKQLESLDILRKLNKEVEDVNSTTETET